MKSIRKTKKLLEAGLIELEKLQEIEKVVEKFSVSITPQLIDLMNSESTEIKKPIQKQFLPSSDELVSKPSELKDPIGDSVHQKVKGIVHRYQDRCLLMPMNSCPVYCRFCFRREVVGDKKSALTLEELEKAFTYIEEHPEIWEVILTGGDPLFLKPKKIAFIMKKLEAISHVEVIRFHTRVPIIDSARVNDELIKALKINKAVYVAIHANHPSEFTEPARKAVAQLVDSGIPLLSQSVLLKKVNDTPEVLGELMRTFVRNRIKPYYLHHSDLAEGTSHFRTTLSEGQALMKSLRSHYSGLCQPTYVLDIPGGFGKIPLNYQYHQACHLKDPLGSTQESFEVEDPKGQIHMYKS